MCGIVRLLPGQMLEEEKLFNLVYNNWHSYGIVIKDGNGGMDVQRIVPESGENDPKVIWKALKDDIDVERILHVRHNTAGATNLENCHPFPILHLPKKGKRETREIVFMHNGTMSEYKSKMYEGGVSKDDPDGPSDTLNFVDQVLVPMTQADYGTGVGDISNPIFRQIIQKFWPYGNRGILIANDQPSYFLGEWKELPNNGDPIKVSNLDYFDKCTRGPEWSRRKAEENKRERSSVADQTKFFTNLKDYNFEEPHGFFKLSESPINLVNDWDMYDREHTVSLGNFTQPELEILYTDQRTCVHVMDWVFIDYANMYKELLEVEEKLDKATKRIAGMAEELKKRNEMFRKIG